MIAWSKFINNRDQIHEQYPQTWDLKLLKRPFWLLKRLLRPHMRILHVGANDSRIKQRVEDVYPDILYKRVDADRWALSAYSSLVAMGEQFDLILLVDVIEHLELEDGVNMLKKVNELLFEGGWLIINTPNIFNPVRFWLDATYKVAYSYEELGGIIRCQGFEVIGIYRTFHDSCLKYVFSLTLFYPWYRILNVDFAKSIVILAGKKEQTLISGDK